MEEVLSMSQMTEHIKLSDISYEKNSPALKEKALKGYEQAINGQTKDFNSVCDRLEKKCRDAILRNRNVRNCE